MTRRNKQVIAAAASSFLLFVGYYGSYLPLHKSAMCRLAGRKIMAAKSMDEVLDLMSAPLNQESPIGQAEALKWATDTVDALIEKYGTKIPGTIAPLIQLLEHYYSPYFVQDLPAAFGGNLLLAGTANLRAYTVLHARQYLDAARRYLELGLAHSPGRPDFIYPLFDVYVAAGNLDRAKELGNLTTTYWPGDSKERAKVAKSVAAMEQRAGQAAAPEAKR